ncbi:hypothetical protein THAOC_00886, partial [Thalassiosira oceanica]
PGGEGPCCGHSGTLKKGAGSICGSRAEGGLPASPLCRVFSATNIVQARDRTGAPSDAMADDGSAKRLKSSQQDGGVAEVAELRTRVAELESEIAKLRLENRQQAGGIAALESENEQLRRQAQRGGNHEVLPVVVSTAVDLSRLDTSIVTQISSFLGTARELLNLALTCKSFGWRQPVSTQNWSVVEEVARQTVCLRATDDEMDSLPSYGVTTWLSILHRYEHLLMFDALHGGCIEHRNGDKSAVFASGPMNCSSVAVSSSYVMGSGVHYAEFLITGEPYIGIVRPMPGLDAGSYQEGFDFFEHSFYTDFLAQRSDDWVNSDVHAIDFSCGEEGVSWTDWDDYEIGIAWDGMESCQSGDTVSMLLNLDVGTLTVYKNNRRLGMMKDGLSGPYCWYVSLANSQTGTDAVSIKRGILPNLGGATTSESRLRSSPRGYS